MIESVFLFAILWALPSLLRPRLPAEPLDLPPVAPFRTLEDRCR